ncbi:MAG TPA: NAD(P)/FAD-dependent oxidoreductase [Thermoanaerobaculia bacterium]|jgi:phytoene dehydrogenase-like protein|nr:NAD(P)/FAD-dependent oxidoreductase [Thermoanaerobaculia bacterium]
MARRPFRALRDRPPKPRYDVVVVGAGIGGLLCANLLVKAGLSVLLVEQHYMVGGFCSTFRRAGFTFDASTHFYPLLGNRKTLPGKLLADLGVETEWVKMDPVDTFHFPDGSRFAVPCELSDYLAAVKARFPHQAEALDRFFAAVREAYLVGLLAYFRNRESPRFPALRDLTLRDVLTRFFDDERLRLLLTADCPHWGSPPSRISFLFDSMLRLSYFLGNYYPVGGSQAFADGLAHCFEERGGDILMSTRVDRILVEDGAAVGVDGETDRGTLAGRHRVLAGAVVCNADLRLALSTLLPPGTVPAAETARAAGLRPSWPCYLTHVGLSGIDAATLEEAQGYHWQRWDADELGDRDDFRNGALRCKVFVPTLYEPAMAPPGKQIIILQKVMPVDYARIADWPAHKQQVQDFMLAQLERAIPGISRHVEVATTATAHTAWRFTLNEEGAMLGWEMAPDQLGDARPGLQGAVRNLVFTGHWVQPGGGITPVIVSAIHAAEAVAGKQLAERVL